jgi:predicted dehydrogenase
MQKLRLGSLGISGHLQKRIVVPVQKLANIEFTAVASRTASKAEAFAAQWNIPKAYDSYEALLADPEIDAVYIPLPNHLHLEWIRKAADAGKHILCEKPLALNEAQAQEAADYTQAKGVKLMEAFMYRFQPMWKRAKELVDVQEIGDIQALHTHFSYNNPNPANIRNILAYGGGGLMDIGCYAISATRYILGSEPAKLVSFIRRDPNFGTDTYTSAIMDFGGRHCSFTVSTLMGNKQEVSIIGSAGHITIHIPFNTFTDVSPSLTVTSGLGTRELKFHPYDQYGLMFQAFADAILTQCPVPTPITDAIHNMRVIDAVLASEVSGTWVNI